MPSPLDFSTTLIADVNGAAFEPVELIVSGGGGGGRAAASPHRCRETSYLDECRTAHRPVNLVVHKASCGVGRSGSLPPMQTRLNLNYRQAHLGQDTDEEVVHVQGTRRTLNNRLLEARGFYFIFFRNICWKFGFS